MNNLFTEEEAAKALGISSSRLRQLRAVGEAPEHIERKSKTGHGVLVKGKRFNYYYPPSAIQSHARKICSRAESAYGDIERRILQIQAEHELELMKVGDENDEG